MKYAELYKPELALIEEGLHKLLPPEGAYPAVIHEAMRYAVLNGGKRFRPLLVLLSVQAVGGKAEDAVIPAAAIEMIHAYSLVHDDLPALDDDDLRRGQPTCHKKFGEDLAILAGDALLTQAFHCLSECRPPELAVQLIREVSTAAGTYGMIGGQVADLVSQGKEMDLAQLDFINVHKTGKLITVSALAGAIVGRAASDELDHIRHYGEALGSAFQTVDDLLDGDGTMKVMSIEATRSKARDLVAGAKRHIRSFGKRGERLIALADYILERMPGKNYVAMD